MQFQSVSDISSWLNHFEHPCLCDNWAETKGIVSVKANAQIEIKIPFSAASMISELEAWISEQQQGGVATQATFTISSHVATLDIADKAALKGVKNIVAVSSAKGGVGKSTTAVNLALALKEQGAKVGLLDADVYGPSVPLMLGKVDAKPVSSDGKLMDPVEAYGLYTNSIGYLVGKNDATIWRGPMASKALAQVMNETCWPELDYLIIDMPPGTGDIQLTLAQQIPVTGVVVVTTPQDLALADAIKGVNMFQKVDVPVLGIVENMSYHICSNCQHEEAIFGTGGAEKMAKEFAIPLLAQLPLDVSIRQDIDKGKPSVAEDPKSDISLRYQALAAQVSSRLFWQGKVVAEQIMFKQL
ncbi:iron-sulfur cluster carrier protein ApbC [Aliivibrio kagoshimensis]|uniref:iron-sulfur cluster carrier protein ApbC n=1 Tax=Aliivibrio kagoshimensis TaxID=2910230 RepID=UPI003D0DA558